MQIWHTTIRGIQSQFITHHNDRYDYLIGPAGTAGRLQVDTATAAKGLRLMRWRRMIPHNWCRFAVSRASAFILDDHVGLCPKVGADGVVWARRMCRVPGPATVEHRIHHRRHLQHFGRCDAGASSVDYIGCGCVPFHHHQAGSLLCYGLDGYRNMVWQCHAMHQSPMVAMGGITDRIFPDVLNRRPQSGGECRGNHTQSRDQWKNPPDAGIICARFLAQIAVYSKYGWRHVTKAKAVSAQPFDIPYENAILSRSERLFRNPLACILCAHILEEVILSPCLLGGYWWTLPTPGTSLILWRMALPLRTIAKWILPHGCQAVETDGERHRNNFRWRP